MHCTLRARTKYTRTSSAYHHTLHPQVSYNHRHLAQHSKTTSSPPAISPTKSSTDQYHRITAALCHRIHRPHRHHHIHVISKQAGGSLLLHAHSLNRPFCNSPYFVLLCLYPGVLVALHLYPFVVLAPRSSKVCVPYIWLRLVGPTT